MRKYDRQRKMYLRTALFLSFIVILGITFFIFRESKKDISPLHTALLSYQSDGDFTLPDYIKYTENSGEDLFCKAFNLYLEDKYEAAVSLLEASLKADSKDPALVVYANLYLNYCSYHLHGNGNLSYVQHAMESMSKYNFLKDNVELLEGLISTVILTAEDFHSIMPLLDNYINNTKDLSPVTIAWIYNYMAVTEYTFQDYDKSIRHFYDAQFALKDYGADKRAAWHLRFTKEYLANIYYLFDDYYNAILKYREVIDMSKYLEAPAEYNTLINLANCYLKTKEYDSALDTIQYLEDNLSDIDPLLIPEIEATIHDVYANIYLEQKQYPLAHVHLSKAEEYYDNALEEYAFYGGKYYILLTRSRLLFAEGKVDKALSLLENLFTLEELSSYGLENDVCQLLKECYQKTDNTRKLSEINEHIINLDKEFMNTIKKEYLQFSEYYEENTQLQNHASHLKKFTALLIFVIVIGTIFLIAIMIIFFIFARMSILDSLTGVYNRKKLNQLSKRYEKHGTPARLGVIMVDIDYFKKYNDSYGHPAGDEVLFKTARTLASSIRKRDILIRYGGEEFLILIPGIDYEIAKAICTRLQESIREARLPHHASPISDFITLSIGMAYQKESSSYSFEELLSKADECLYSSKDNGRNTMTSISL